MNAKNNMKETFLLGWVIFLLLGGVFLLINFIIEMPYDKWLSENIPGWLSVVNCILLGTCFVTMALHISDIADNLAGTAGLLFAIISKTTFSKALWINIIVILVSVILFIAIKHRYRKCKQNSQNDANEENRDNSDY